MGVGQRSKFNTEYTVRYIIFKHLTFSTHQDDRIFDGLCDLSKLSLVVFLTLTLSYIWSSSGSSPAWKSLLPTPFQQVCLRLSNGLWKFTVSCAHPLISLSKSANLSDTGFEILKKLSSLLGWKISFSSTSWRLGEDCLDNSSVGGTLSSLRKSIAILP